MSYVVSTPQFGDITIAADDIRDARRRASRAFGVGPRCVRAVRQYRRCECCDSSPCAL